MLGAMGYAALCAAIVGIAALCADTVLAGRGRARRWVWLAAIVVSVALPILLPLLRVVSTHAGAFTAVSVSESARIEGSSTSRLDITLLFAWIGASVTLAAILLTSAWRTARLVRSCRRELIAGRDVLISSDFGPALVGAFRSRIIIPAWTLTLPDGDLAFVVMHEDEHARSRDPMLALTGVCSVVLMPWNVALWWQLSRLRLALELDCDTRVVARRPHDALDYSRLLLSVRERSGGARHAALALSHSRSRLARRLDALLRRGRPRNAQAVGLVTLGTALLATVGFVPSPNAVTLIDAFRRPPSAALAVVRDTTIAPAGRSQATVSSTRTVHADTKPQRDGARAMTKTLNERVTALAMSSMPPVRVISSNPMARLSATESPLPRGRGGFISRVGGSGGVGATMTPNAAGFVIRSSAAAGGVSAGGGTPVMIRAVPRATAPTPPDTLVLLRR